MRKKRGRNTVAGFRNRRVMLLILAVLISGVLIIGPGPHWGIDITGGSRIMLHLEAREATVKFSPPPDNFSKATENVKETLESRLHTNVIILSADDKTSELNLVIGKAVREDVVDSLLGEGTQIAEFKEAHFDREPMGAIREELIDHLKFRVDPYGTLGAQFKPLGSEYVLFEVSLGLKHAKKLLGHEGRLEMFVENHLAFRGEYLKSVGSVKKGVRERGYYIPFELTEEGAQRFASASENKGGYPGVIYLDRPDEAILVFAENPYSPTLKYDSKKKKFLYSPPHIDHPFHLQVPAIKIGTDSIPKEAQEFLENQKGLKTRTILVGRPKDFSENVVRGGNLVVDNVPLYPIINKVGSGELEIVKKICGAKSWPSIRRDIAGKVTNKLEISNIGDLDEAKDLQVILSQRLPVKVSHASEVELDPRLGRGFLWEALQAGLAAFIAVGALVYIRYRRLRIAIPLMLTMLCEVVITLGFSSALPDSVMSIGLPEIGGLIAVVGTGVDHQIIITDEILGGKSPGSGRMPVERRTGKAFSIIFAAAATTIAAMVALAGLGFGAMRGFAIIAIIGCLISVLITRPAYARIVGTLLLRE